MFPFVEKKTTDVNSAGQKPRHGSLARVAVPLFSDVDPGTQINVDPDPHSDYGSRGIKWREKKSLPTIYFFTDLKIFFFPWL